MSRKVALVDNTLRNLHNSLDHIQPCPIIDSYCIIYYHCYLQIKNEGSGPLTT